MEFCLNSAIDSTQTQEGAVKWYGEACEKHCHVSLGARCLREDWPWHGKVKGDVMEWLSNSKKLRENGVYLLVL